MSEREDDSDAPEEFTLEQGFRQDEELRKAQTENRARIVREGKERRRQWAQKKTPRKSGGFEKAQDLVEDDSNTIDEDETQPGRVGSGGGMLPSNIVEVLAAREKQVFSSDSEEEVQEKPTSNKKRAKRSGLEAVILKDIPPAQCLQSSLEFLKKQKMQVPRSSSALNNSHNAFRFLSKAGLLGKK